MLNLGAHFEAHFGQVPDKWEMSRSAAALFCMYAAVYLTSVARVTIWQSMRSGTQFV